MDTKNKTSVAATAPALPKWQQEGTCRYLPAKCPNGKPFAAVGPYERDHKIRWPLGWYATSAEAWHAIRCYTRMANPGRDW